MKKRNIIITIWIILIIGLGTYISLNPLQKEVIKESVIEKPFKPKNEKFSFSFIGLGNALIHDGV